jgi:hypothetical protein
MRKIIVVATDENSVVLDRVEFEVKYFQNTITLLAHNSNHAPLLMKDNVGELTIGSPNRRT